MRFIAWVCWICIGAIIIGLTGHYAIFIMPLLLIGWHIFLRPTFLPTPQETAEIQLEMMIRMAVAKGPRLYLTQMTYADLVGHLQALRPLIGTDLMRFTVLAQELESPNDAVRIRALVEIEAYVDQLNAAAGHK